jgi:hypothetical protein
MSITLNLIVLQCRRSSGVEQRIRNAWVGGSIPLDGTITSLKSGVFKVRLRDDPGNRAR